MQDNMPEMKVGIDPNQCASCGLCEAILPEQFGFGDDGLGYVIDANGNRLNYPAMADVPAELQDDVRQVESDCAGQAVIVI